MTMRNKNVIDLINQWHLIHSFVGKALYVVSILYILVTEYWGARDAQAASFDNPLKAEDLDEFLVTVVEVVITLGIPIAGLFIIYAGFLFVSARGNAEQLTKAKRTLLWAIVGSAILLGAFIIIGVIESTIETVT